MKMETINLTPTEQRVLLLFGPESTPSEVDRVSGYLREHDLEPKRQYHEVRDGQEYLVFYFGHCYLEDHLPAIEAIMAEAKP